MTEKLSRELCLNKGINMKIILASNNENKRKEIAEILKPYDIELLSPGDARITHETTEDGCNFYENARKKAYEMYELTGMASVADDSGLCVSALGGRPGIYSARYVPDGTGMMERCRKLLAEMENEDDRIACFITVVVGIFADGTEIKTEGRIDGEITRDIRGNNGFGFDPVFLIPDKGKTYAEMEAFEKNAISHRAEAFKQFGKKSALKNGEGKQ